MYHVAVGFAHLFKTNPLGKRAAQKGQLFGVVFILVIIRLLRVRIRERFIVQRKVDFQRFVRLPLGSDTEHFIQVFRRNLPGVFGYIRGHKYIGFFRNFFSFRFYGSLWPGVARVEDKAAPADDLLPAGSVFGNDPVCRFVAFHPPQAEKRPQGIPHGKEGQQPQRPVHRSSALGCREATASRSSKSRSMVSRLSSRCALRTLST